MAQPTGTLELYRASDLLNITDPADMALAGFLARCKSPGTFRCYRINLRIFHQWCLSNRLSILEVKPAHLDLFCRWIEQQGWSQATVQQRVNTVCQFYKYCARTYLLERDPSINVSRPELDKAQQKRTFLPALAMAQWLQAAEAESPTALLLGGLLGMMGLRISEACSLNLDEIKVIKGWDCVSFTGKGNKYAVVPIPVPVGRMVATIRAERQTGPMLTTTLGTRMNRQSADRLIKKVAAAALISTDISPHSFRRTMCTTLLQNGVSIYEAQKAMRHSDPKTTQIYDLAASSLDRNATHQAAAFYASIGN